jgi:TonB-linked SusC/RagA family outer membrane protein
MKKKLQRGEGFYPHVKKVFWIMRLSILLIVSAVFSSAASVYSQSTKLTLKMENKRIAEVFDAIEQQSEFYFFYNRDNFDDNRVVSVNIKEKLIEDILYELLKDQSVSYEIIDRNILIKASGRTESFLTQQQNAVTGKISDKNGAPLPGVTVVIKGTTTGTITDTNGNYILANIPPNATLVFSFVGMRTQEIAVGNQTAINVTMQEETIGIDEVVAIGYGTSSKRVLTSAISTVDADKFRNLPVPSITDGLAGRAAGLIVTQSGGGIGKKSNISIRGGGTPIVVVDGYIVPYADFQNLNTEDIESMSILKDASAAAVYGARAGDGVLVVTTKKGITGLNVDYSYNTNFSEPTYLERKLDSYERATFDNLVRSTYKLDPRWTQAELDKFRTGSDPWNYPNTDWQKIMLRDFAQEDKHSLTLRGGTEINKFFVSLQTYDQGSVYTENTNWLKRHNIRISETSDFKKIGLVLHFGADGYIEETRHPRSQYNTAGYFATWGHIQNQGPGGLAYNDKGQIYVGYDNPLAEISPESGYNLTSNKMLNTMANATWDVYGVQGLKVKVGATYRIGVSTNKTWTKTAVQYDLQGNPGPSFPVSLSYQNWNNYQYTTQAFLDYDRTFGDSHNVKATAGYEQTYGFGQTTWLQRRNYIFMIDQIGAGPSSTMENSGSENEFGRAGYIGRVSYNYNRKYFAEGSMRHDGSDLFPEDKRWGTFFSGSVGYAISEESFWQPLKENDIINFFKLRGSFGQVGLDSGVGRFSYLSSYGLNERGYVLDGKLVPTFSEGALVSRDITWFTTNSTDVGFDFTSLRDRLSGSFDYFFMKTSGYLSSPSGVGYTDPLGLSLPNVKSKGESRRAGYEFALSWKDMISDFSYEVGANFTYFDQLVAVAWNEDLASQKNPYRRQVQQTGYWGIGYVNAGYYNSSDDVMNSPKIEGSNNLVAGDVKYKDINGDGFIDGADQTRIGKNGFPRGNFGIFSNLGYKGFFANILFQGSTSRNLYISDVIRGQSTGGYTMVYPFQLDYWMPDNRNALFPRIAPNSSINGNNNYQQSDFWLTDGRYIRLKTLQVGYDLKSRILKNIDWLAKLDLVLSGQNLFTISPALKYGFDPETGSTNNYDYPVQRIYSLSVNVGF